MYAKSFTLPLAALLALVASASPGRAAVNLPGNATLETVDFERHIVGLFGRAGCNMGSCHGSFQGKGGFRLSLFGFDPTMDYTNVTRDTLARRVSSVNPDGSLLLLKATGQVEHAGGVRFQKDSWQYQIIKEWMQQGAPWTPGSGDVVKIILTPPEWAFKKAGEKIQIKVEAKFADGSISNITPFCDFKTNDDAVAEVTNMGQVTSLRPGNTAIVVNYRGNVLPVRVLIPMDLAAGFKYPKVSENNFIDKHVFDRLKLLNMVPSDLATDEEFLRRLYIDTTGSLPAPEEVRKFLADKSPTKRAKLIDDLLVHPLHAAMWAVKFSDITGNDTPALEQPVPLKTKRSQLWHDWFRKRVQENMPYDEIVKGVLTATSREGMTPEAWLEHTKKIDKDIVKEFSSDDYAKRSTLDLFWRRQQNVPIEQWAEKTAAAFMGVRIECAQCHKHPFDRWTQVDYRSYASIFGSLAFGISPDAKKVVDAENAARKKTGAKNNQLSLVKEVYVANTSKTLTHPDTGRLLTPKALGGPEIKFEKNKDPRADLFEWLRSKDNPFFARSFVNRIWGHYFGLGIVHPVDDFSLGNPPSNDKLLDALAQEFIKSGFNIRHMEKLILNSRVYQLSSKVNDTNKLDKNNYSHAYVRPMMAEAVVDVLNSALGTVERFGNDVKAGSKAVEIGASQLQNPALTYAFRIFGRPPRTAACDCERTMEPALPQKLYLMTDASLLTKLNDPAGRLMLLVNSKKPDNEVLDELFLSTLTRLPTQAEQKAFAAHRQTTDRRTAFTDTLWALINTREFILNH